jgi:hypothetical protein
MMSNQLFPQNDPTHPGTNMPTYMPPVPVPPPAPNAGDSTATTDVAKEQATDLASGAKDAAGGVVDTAKQQSGEVVREAKTQFKQVVGQAQSELSDQAQTQQARAASGLHALGDQLSAMASGTDQPGPASDVAQQAAEKAHQFAGWLENRDPRGVLDEVRSFARRKPGMFLVAALGAGVLAGRLTRRMTADTASMGSSGASVKNGDVTRGAVSPTPDTMFAAQLSPDVPDGSNDLGTGDYLDLPGQRRAEAGTDG